MHCMWSLLVEDDFAAYSNAQSNKRSLTSLQAAGKMTPRNHVQPLASTGGQRSLNASSPFVGLPVVHGSAPKDE